ncbi:MAG: hypothetical protein ACI4J0_04940 [Huintestinicola sp.]|uniref:hypothetical protein n=1 Tax=Huintestinicola sp. TaxID=2981661 RepID=UPI003F0D0776
MTALIIIAALILIILLAVNIPVEAYIRFYGGKADIKVKYFFLSLYPKKEKPPKSKKKRRKDKPPKEEELSLEEEMISEDISTEEVPEDTPNEDAAPKEDTVGEEGSPQKGKPQKEKKPPLLERINAKLDELTRKKNSVMLLIELVTEPLKRFGSKIRIDDVIIDFAAADEDAAKAAISYGRIGAAVYDTISFLRCFVGMSVRSINISCLYNTPADKSRYDGECKVRLRPASLLNAVFAVGFGYISNKKKYSPVMELFKKG